MQFAAENVCERDLTCAIPCWDAGSHEDFKKRTIAFRLIQPETYEMKRGKPEEPFTVTIEVQNLDR